SGRRSCRSRASKRTRIWRCTPEAGSGAGGTVSSSEPTKIDVRERGADAQLSDRRLYVQLQVFTGCLDSKPLVQALESSRIEAALYQDVNDPRGVGVLALSEDPEDLELHVEPPVGEL